MMGVPPLLPRHDRGNVRLDLSGRRPLRQPQTVRHAKNVRIDRERSFFECNRHHDVCRLPADAVERFQIVALARHLAAETLDQIARRANDMLGLHAIEPARFDDPFDVGETGFCQLVGRWIGREQRGGREIHARIRALCGENHRDEQLERIVVLKRRDGRRIRAFEDRQLLLGDRLRDVLGGKRNFRHGRVTTFQKPPPMSPQAIGKTHE